MTDDRTGAGDERADAAGLAHESGPAALEPALALAHAALALKDVTRAGWDLRGVEAPESVADHSYGTALLCMLYAAEAGVDRERSVAIALVHDLAETITGDVIARVDPEDRDVSESDKSVAEARAMEELPGSANVVELWREYEDRSTAEALFVRDMNLLDMCLQAMRYEAEGRYDASRPVASRGGYVHLDEFFDSAARRLHGAVAKRLFTAVEAHYLAIRHRAGED